LSRSGLAPTGEILSFACPKEKNPKKTTPCCRGATHSLALLAGPGGNQTRPSEAGYACLTAELKQVIAETPGPTPLLSAAEGKGGTALMPLLQSQFPPSFRRKPESGFQRNVHPNISSQPKWRLQDKIPCCRAEQHSQGGGFRRGLSERKARVPQPPALASSARNSRRERGSGCLLLWLLSSGHAEENSSPVGASPDLSNSISQPPSPQLTPAKGEGVKLCRFLDNRDDLLHIFRHLVELR